MLVQELDLAAASSRADATGNDVVDTFQTTTSQVMVVSAAFDRMTATSSNRSRQFLKY